MEWLASLHIEQILAFFLSIFFLVILLAFLARKGLFSFSGKGLSIGNVRETITRQMEYVNAVAKEFCASIGDSDKAKYIRESCKDILDKAIVLNSMSNSESYVLVKSLSVWAEIQRHDIPEQYRTDEFKSKIFNLVRKTIEELVKMKTH